MDTETFFIENVIAAFSFVSESILMRDGLFDEVIYHEAIASPVFLNYLRFESQLGSEEKTKLMENFLCKSKHFIRESIVGRQPLYADKYPELFKAENQFIDWYYSKQQMPSHKKIINLNRIEKLNISSVIKEVVKEKHPEFDLYNNRHRKDVVPFLKRITDSVSFMVSFNIGIKRMFFSVEIGFDYPPLFVDIANFFARSQSMFDYNSVQDIKNGISIAFTFIECVLPEVFRKLVEGQQSGQESGGAPEH